MLCKRNFVVCRQITWVLLWCPDFSFIDNMLYLPTSLMKLSCNPFPVTFPRKAFCTDNDREFCESERLKEVNSLYKVISTGICKISPFSEATKFFSEKMVFQFFMLQERFEVFSSEYRELAFRETPHIYQGFDIVGKENLYKIFFSSSASAKGIYLFHSPLSYHFFLDKPSLFGIKIMPTMKTVTYITGDEVTFK